MITIIKNYSLNDLKLGVNKQLENAAHSEEVRHFAIDITGDPNKDPILAIYQWVKNNLRYVPDPVDIELFTSPVRLVKSFHMNESIAEDCDGHAIFTTALYRSIGIPAHVVFVNSNGGDIDHAITTVWSEKLSRWIDVDTTAQFPMGWEFKYSTRITI
jgi:transglutaminase-like putative cysteine protease